MCGNPECGPAGGDPSIHVCAEHAKYAERSGQIIHLLGMLLIAHLERDARNEERGPPLGPCMECDAPIGGSAGRIFPGKDDTEKNAHYVCRECHLKFVEEGAIERHPAA